MVHQRNSLTHPGKGYTSVSSVDVPWSAVISYPRWGGEGDYHIKREQRCSSEILKKTRKGDQFGRGPTKRDHFKLWLHEWSKQNELKNIYIFIFLRTTFMAKYSGVLPRTPQVRPKSEICITKRDDKHPCPFHMGVSPGLWSLILSRVTPKECTQRNWSRDLTNTIFV